MKRHLLLTFDIDPAAWAEEYGVPLAEAEDDIVNQIEQSRAPMVDLLNESWPLMREHANLSAAGPDCNALVTALDLPGATAVILDAFTTDNLRGFLASLDADTRTSVAKALREIADDENDRQLISEIRKVVAAQHLNGVKAVVFETTEYPNGYYLDSASARVLFEDGTDDIDVDFGERVEELLTGIFGARGAGFTLSVNLQTEKLLF